MRTGITIEVSASDKVRLEAIVSARGSPQKHVWRARIILLTEQGLGTTAIMSATGKGTVRNFVCGRAVEHYAAMALMKRSPNRTAHSCQPGAISS